MPTSYSFFLFLFNFSLVFRCSISQSHSSVPVPPRSSAATFRGSFPRFWNCWTGGTYLCRWWRLDVLYSKENAYAYHLFLFIYMHFLKSHCWRSFVDNFEGCMFKDMLRTHYQKSRRYKIRVTPFWWRCLPSNFIPRLYNFVHFLPILMLVLCYFRNEILCSAAWDRNIAIAAVLPNLRRALVPHPTNSTPAWAQSGLPRSCPTSLAADVPHCEIASLAGAGRC